MNEDSERGLYEKYKIEHTDGRPIDPNAQYLVIRYDRPEDAINRELVRMFALTCGNEQLKEDLLNELNTIESSALCPYCNGAGEVRLVGIEDCAKCNPVDGENGVCVSETKVYRCGNCGGRGRILSLAPKKTKWMCPACMGTGGKMDTDTGKIDACKCCNGDGWVLK